MDKYLVNSVEQLVNFTSYTRQLRKGFTTNFFLNNFKHNLWIEKSEFFYYHIGETFFLIRENGKLIHLFYITTTIECLKSDLKTFLTLFISTCDIDYEKKLVIDIVGGDAISNITDVFVHLGFVKYQSLHRMSRCGILNIENINYGDVFFADLCDLQGIMSYFVSYFDPISEQLPLMEELVELKKNNCILVCKINDEIAGFLIYEVQGITLYLRYWFVHPNYRNRKIGSKLFSKFKEIGIKTKRQLFWVIDNNENAIKRYKHYGFESEKMFNYVLLYKKQ